jgi:hypothetical protein
MKNEPTEQPPSAALDMGPQQIVIADRGWVWVGNSQVIGDQLVVENARCIRRWGTTKGLGELAAGGPTPDTVLDPMGRLVVPMRAVIGRLACEAAW